jgi:hypothetical protein
MNIMILMAGQNGYRWAFPARPEDLVIIKGDENTTLKGYDFANRGMTHKVRNETSAGFVILTMHCPVLSYLRDLRTSARTRPELYRRQCMCHGCNTTKSS